MLAMTKLFVMTKLCLSQQNIFVTTKVCLSLQIFLSSVLLRQTCVCHDKSKLIMFVTTKICLSRQAYFYWDKRRVLSRQTFVKTKMILVAAPTNDSNLHYILNGQQSKRKRFFPSLSITLVELARTVEEMKR